MKAIKKKDKIQLFRKNMESYLMVFSGSIILAIGYSFFIVPHNIVPGGVFGLSIVLHEMVGWTIGTISLCINIPLLVWGTKILGRKAGLKTAFSMFTVSIAVDIILWLTNKEALVNDILVSAIFGGIMIGVAVAIVMNAGATTGGNDIFVRILAKKIVLPFDQLLLLTDALIVLIGVIVYANYTMAAYCIISIVSISKTIEYIINKSSENKTVLIFSQNNSLIQQQILDNELMNDNIVELIHHDSDEKMILITKNKKKFGVIEQLIYSADPKAYIISLESKTKLI